MSLARFAFGAVTAPRVGLGGAATALPLGFVSLASVLLGVLAYPAVRREVIAPRAA